MGKKDRNRGLFRSDDKYERDSSKKDKGNRSKKKQKGKGKNPLKAVGKTLGTVTNLMAQLPMLIMLVVGAGVLIEGMKMMH